ncbi:pullulanase [Tepiditoga spiralis]|uniref:pullulanase n=1 Tax=Tepiditoga spiralis TaxID=2108365 RepID=A0A7G1GA02_9BACT|nr:type I pullulanase [Tepiditoga spiralis]BBE32114.1 pullulanase [Tepiditoga spiralis]
MKKKFFMVLVFSLLLNVIFASQFKPLAPSITSKSKTTVIIHYNRPDGNYEKWNLWIWPKAPVGLDGKRYLFTGKDNFGKYAIINFDDKYTKIGFIVRTDKWEKDVSIDRFIDIPKNGIAEIWVLSDTEKFYTDPQKIDLGPKVKSIIIDSLDSIKVNLTKGLNVKTWKNKIKVLSGNTELKIDSVVKTDPTDISTTTSITINLSNKITDVSKLLTVKIRGFTSNNYGIMRNVLDNEIFRYEKNDLGLTYTKEKATFKVWSPVSSKVELILYDDFYSNKNKKFPMKKNKEGVWELSINGDLEGKSYLYELTSYGEKHLTPDIYSKAVTLNSQRSAIINLNKTNIKWRKRPILNDPVDSIIYETHVKDFTLNKNSGVTNKGKYIGLVEENTSYNGYKTGLEHLKELGITHIHLMPFQDIGSLDENNFSQYGWGYDPKLYFVPDGLYSTNPKDPYTRIKEVKEMVNTLHKNGIRLIMDVVYNHTFQIGKDSPFDQTVPYYYYRTNSTGKYINGSGCGNSIATERYMVRKYILDSLKYWINNYHVDGFRFDLLGMFDKETVELISKELHKELPSILLYGEPWTGGGKLRFGKGDQKNLNIAVFNDDVRNAIRGSVSVVKLKGFGLGGFGKETRIKRGIVGSIEYNSLIRSWTNSPQETINYVSNHDNNTLWDKNALALGLKPWKNKISEKDLNLLKQSQKFSNAIILTMQGIPFLSGGVEFCRSKEGNGNPYNIEKPNIFDWSLKEKNYDVFKYYKDLISLRKDHPAFKLTNSKDIKNSITFFKSPKKVVSFEINYEKDSWKDIIVIYNANLDKTIEFNLPNGVWNLVVNGNTVNMNSIKNMKNNIEVTPLSIYILYKNN